MQPCRIDWAHQADTVTIAASVSFPRRTHDGRYP